MIDCKVELRAVQARIGQRERVIFDLNERVCLEYNSLMQALTSSYLDPLNAVLGVGQARGECLGGFRVRVGEVGHSLHVGGEKSNEERGDRTSPTKGGDGADDYLVVPPSTSPS